MPVILAPEDWSRWLTGENIAELLKPCPDEVLKGYPVGRAVNSPKKDGPELVEALARARARVIVVRARRKSTVGFGARRFAPRLRSVGLVYRLVSTINKRLGAH